MSVTFPYQVFHATMWSHSGWKNVRVWVSETHPRPRPSQSQKFKERNRPKPSSRQDSDWQKNSSDGSSDWRWTSWNAKEEWIQDEIYKEQYEYIEIEKSHTDMYRYQNVESSEQERSKADLHEEMIRNSKNILQRHCRGVPVHRSAKNVRSSQPVLQHHPGETLAHRSAKRGRSPSPQNIRRGQKSKSFSNQTQYEDDKRSLIKIGIGQLRYSQKTCKDVFQCGRTVNDLVEDLLNKKVSLFAPFLRLTVFETTDEETNETVMKCIDNRRLSALKAYAFISGKDEDEVMVNVNFYSQSTIKEVQRFLRNSDKTDGRDVRVRESRLRSNRRNRNTQRRRKMKRPRPRT